jgi:hypothetical protein
MNHAMQYIADNHDVDFIFCLDADEFIKAESKEHLSKGLQHADSQHAIVVDWVNYVPTAEDDSSEKNTLRRIRHRQEAEHETHRKLVVPKGLFNDSVIAHGSHVLLHKDCKNHHQHKLATHFQLAHFPIRSKEQMFIKFLLNEWSWMLKKKDRRQQISSGQDKRGGHVGEMYNKLITSLNLSDKDYLDYCRNVYGSSSVALVIDPIEDFSGPIDLKYTDLIATNILGRVVGFTDTLIRSMNQSPQTND